MIDDPRAVAATWPDDRVRMLATLAVTVAETPWVAMPPLPTDDLAHAVALAAFFGHLNRIADAVAVPLDYPVAIDPPHADPTTPALAPAPTATALAFALARPATARAFEAWHEYTFDRDAPLPRSHRALIARHTGALLGQIVDGPLPTSTLEHRLVELVSVVTLAPWQLSDTSYAPLRAAGFDDTTLFDAIVTASTAGMRSRIAVALQ